MRRFGSLSVQSKVCYSILLFVLIAAAILRIYRLSDIPPGVWVDEAIEALQGIALWSGEQLPLVFDIPFPRWPIWCGVQAVTTAVLGYTPFAIRLPAALIGLASVYFAYRARKVLFGLTGGVVSATFLAFSFWHLNFSRMALPCNLVIAESLVVAWVLLRPGRLTVWHGILISGISASACFGYAASMVTPVLAVLFSLIRFIVKPEEKKERKILLSLLVSIALFGILFLTLQPESLSRTQGVGIASPVALVKQLYIVISHCVFSCSASWGYWYNFPPGAPRFDWVELIVLLAGATAIGFTRFIPGWQRLALVVWIFVSLAPEVLPGGGIHLIRGLPLLAPAALLAGAGGAAISRLFATRGFLVVVALLFLGGVESSDRLLRRFANDSRVASWYSQVEVDAAAYVKQLSRESSVYMVGVPRYETAPLLRFHLLDAINSKRIVETTCELVDPHLLQIFRGPRSRQPILFVMASRRSLKGHTHIGLVNIEGLLKYGQDMMLNHDYAGAEEHFRHVLGLAPDSAATQGRLGMALVAQKKYREALPYLRFVLSVAPDDSVYRAALSFVRQKIGH